MNIKIYYSEQHENINEQKFNELLFSLPNNIQKSVSPQNGFKQVEKSVIGKQLLIKAIADNGSESDLKNLKVMSSGRPFISHNHKSDFNISHSGNLVACAYSNSSAIGIDIEKIKPREISDFKNQFSTKEWLQIKHANDPLELFYTYWTMKESVLKADGIGILNSLSSVKIVSKKEAIFSGEKWYLMKINLSDNYVCHIASKLKKPEIEYCKINI